MKELSFCPLGDIYILAFQHSFYRVSGLCITVRISETCYLELTACSSNNILLKFLDGSCEYLFAFDSSQSPSIIVLPSQILVPQFNFLYSPNSCPASFKRKEVTINSSIPFFFASTLLSSSTDSSTASFLSLKDNFLFSSYLERSIVDTSLFSLTPCEYNLPSLVSPKSLPRSASPSTHNTTSNSFSSSSAEPVDLDDDDDLIQAPTLSHFLEEHSQLKPSPIVIPPFASLRPRLSIVLYTFQSFVSHLICLCQSLFLSPGLLFPYLRAISQYLHGRNRYPLLTYFIPLFTSLASIYFLSISGTAPFLIYGAISYLLVGRMLKISYASSKILRRIGSDTYPLLFLSQIAPLFFFIFLLKLFAPLQFFVLTILFYIYCQLFQYVLKFSHFIGDARMFFKLSPSVSFAIFSYFGYDNPSFFLPISFVSVILLMCAFPRIFRLQDP